MRTAFQPALRLVVFAGVLAACAGSVGQHVWVDQYRAPPGAEATDYLLVEGDLVQLKVFEQEQLSTRARVRADGKISVPLLGDVQAAGLTPNALAADVKAALTDFVKAPNVTVSLEETRPPAVYVTGHVVRPGTYPLDPKAPGVLPAIVTAGGLTPYARKDRIFVVRGGAPARIRFAYEGLTRAETAANRFKLLPGDVVVVE